MSSKYYREVRILCFKIIFQRTKIGLVPLGEKILFDESGLPDSEKNKAKELIEFCRQNIETIDSHISKNLRTDWKQDRLNSSLNTLLRMGAAEILYGKNINPKILINDVLEICKIFCEPVTAKICNALLDKIWTETLKIKNENLKQEKNQS